MLSDKEKEALERIDYIQDFIIENGQYNADVNEMEYFSRIKNLIEKQQKEIEELKDINKKLEARKYMYNAETGEVTAIPIDNNYISKDKIKAKVEKLEQNASYDEILAHIPRID